MAGAFVVLPHRQRRTPQRLGFLPLQRPALELLGHLGGDHLEDTTPQDPQRLRIMVSSQLHQVGLRGRPLLGRDRELACAREPLQRRHDRPALGDVDPTRSHRRRQHLVLLDLLCQAEVGAGLAAYLPGLDRDPVRCGAGTGLDRGLGLLGVGEQPQRERVELRVALREGDQGGALVLGSHRHQRRIGQRIQTRRPAAGRSRPPGGGARPAGCSWSEFKHRATDRKGPLTCGFVQISRPFQNFSRGPQAGTKPAMDCATGRMQGARQPERLGSSRNHPRVPRSHC